MAAVDYITLLKESERWMIIAKRFHSTPKRRFDPAGALWFKRTIEAPV